MWGERDLASKDMGNLLYRLLSCMGATTNGGELRLVYHACYPPVHYGAISEGGVLYGVCGRS